MLIKNKGRAEACETIMALHPHMNNIFDLLDVQWQKYLNRQLHLNSIQNHLHTEFYNKILQSGIQYGKYIYKSIGISAKTKIQ